MKKLIIPLIGLFVVTIVLVSWRSHNSSKDAAVVIKDVGCGMLDGDGGFVFSSSDQSVITSNGSGKSTCKASGVPNSTGKAVKWNFDNTGFLCGAIAGPTDDWQEVVSASGQATLQCHVH